MKGIIIGTDLLEHNSDVKILETNTNTTIFNDGADLLDYDGLFTMLNTNSITEFHYIWTEGDSYYPLNQQYRFKQKLEEKCVENNISFTEYTVAKGSITVPYVEDSENKFILRQAFDTTALVDDTYSADKFEFFALMSGSGYTPETFFVDSVLGIDSVTDIADNGVAPNMIIKPRYPQYSQELYPELHKLTSNSEIEDLKSQTPTNHLLQEFIYDDANLVEGRYSIIRSIDIIYGSNLDVINMGGYKQSAIIPIDFFETEFVGETTKLNQKSRYKYITKEVGNSATNDYHTDEDSVILDYTGSLLDVDSIKLGDYVRSIDFVDFNDNHAANFTERIDTFGWDSTLQQSNETLTQMSSSLTTMFSSSVDTVYIRITLEDGKSWVDAPSCAYYIQESGSLNTRFEKLNKMYVGDKLITTDSDTNELTSIEIVGLEMEYAQKTIYTLDFEPSDLFLVDIGEGLYSVMHNGCWCPWGSCGQACNEYGCPGCGGGKSDISYKENVNLIGQSPLGINIYEFNYIGEEGLYQGVIAQELVGTKYENALTLNNEGKYLVDYNQIDVEFKKID
jgi:hypothetical protein